MGSAGKPRIGEVWPVGMGFRPTDDELINHYLKRKLRGLQEDCLVIPELDIYEWEAQALFEKYDEMSDLKPDGGECFFYYVRKGNNRMTRAGFWKETRKKHIVKGRDGKPTGSKRILVYHEGRQPKGRKSHYSMHEYHLNCPSKPSMKGPKREIVLCRIINRAIRRISPDSPSPECTDPDPAIPGGNIANQGDNVASPLVWAPPNLTDAELGVPSNERDDAEADQLPQHFESLCGDEQAESGAPSNKHDDAEVDQMMQYYESLPDDEGRLFAYNDQFPVVGGSSNTVSYSDYGPADDDDGVFFSELWG